MVKKYEVWLADLDPRFGSEAGKTRPVVVVQSDLINGKLNFSMICPITSKVVASASILRLHLSSGEAGLSQDSDILVAQIRAIDNQRFIRKLGSVPTSKRQQLDENLKIVLDLP